MKFLIINHRYFVSGGPERYMFNLKELLEGNGHTVIPFSIKYSQNEKSDFSEYFASPVANEDEIYFNDQTWNARSFFNTVGRLFYSKEVYTKLTALIKKEKPQLAIVLLYLRKLSPSVLSALNDSGIPFVVRISDFGMICPNNLLIRKGKICEKCIKGSSFNSIWYKCVKNSFFASALQYVATGFHNLNGYFKAVPAYLVPSRFTLQKMMEAGWDKNKLVHFPTFVKNDFVPETTGKKNQVIYVGRLDEEKGLILLLDAINIVRQKKQNLDEIKFFIIGTGTNEFTARLKDFADAHRIKNLFFTGNLNKNDIINFMNESLFLVAPSLWYDNMPNSVLEALASGLPVIAPDHGSFPEIIINNSTGLLFEPGNKTDLAEKISILAENDKIRAEMSINSKKFIRENHSPERHYAQLMDICKNHFKMNLS